VERKHQLNFLLTRRIKSGIVDIESTEENMYWSRNIQEAAEKARGEREWGTPLTRWDTDFSKEPYMKVSPNGEWVRFVDVRGERGTPDAEIVAELKADLASRPDLEERWFDLAEIFCPHCKTDGWPTNDQHGKLWHLTPSVLCTAAHIWYLRGDTKTTELLAGRGADGWEREPNEK
jgi:hypothetical protein